MMAQNGGDNLLLDLGSDMENGYVPDHPNPDPTDPVQHNQPTSGAGQNGELVPDKLNTFATDLLEQATSGAGDALMQAQQHMQQQFGVDPGQLLDFGDVTDSSLDRLTSETDDIDLSGGEPKPNDPGPISPEQLVEETFELKRISHDTINQAKQVDVDLQQQQPVHAQIIGDFTAPGQQPPEQTPAAAQFSPSTVSEQVFAAAIGGLDSFLNQQEQKPSLPGQIEVQPAAKKEVTKKTTPTSKAAAKKPATASTTAKKTPTASKPGASPRTTGARTAALAKPTATSQAANSKVATTPAARSRPAAATRVTTTATAAKPTPLPRASATKKPTTTATASTLRAPRPAPATRTPANTPRSSAPNSGTTTPRTTTGRAGPSPAASATGAAMASASKPNPRFAHVSSKVGSVTEHKPGGGKVQVFSEKKQYVAQSKVGSLSNATHTPGGGKVRIENRKLEFGKSAKPRIEATNPAAQKPMGGDKKIHTQKLDWKAESKVGSLSNTTHRPTGGAVKIQNQKLEWKAESKIGFRDNEQHRPGGGQRKVVSQKLDFSAKAQSKIGSLDNANHVPSGGNVKIQEAKLDFDKKAKSKVGSLDNAKHSPSGGDVKIFDQKLKFQDSAKSKIGSLPAPGSTDALTAEQALM